MITLLLILLLALFLILFLYNVPVGRGMEERERERGGGCERQGFTDRNWSWSTFGEVIVVQNYFTRLVDEHPSLLFAKRHHSVRPYEV